MADPRMGEIERAVLAGVRTALQGIIVPQPSTQSADAAPYSNPHPPPAAAAGTSGSSGTVTSLRSVPLPSFPRHNRARFNQRHVKTYTKEIVCLPFSPDTSVFAIPRGVPRARLAQAGLVGKISFSSEWSEDQLQTEISAIFRGAFGLLEHQTFPFHFLSTIKGCKKLMIPKVSSTFSWGGKEVASVCSTTCLYIMARMEVPAQIGCGELSDDSDFESPVLQRRRVAQRDAPSAIQLEYFEDQQDAGTSAPSDPIDLQAQQRPNDYPSDITDLIFLQAEEDEAIEEAIRRSLSEEPVQSFQVSRFANTLTREEIRGVLKAHSERVVTTAYRPIYISRRNVWTTALRQFSRKRFAESTDSLYVTFASDEDASEEAEDLGGPRREFFRLLIKAIYRESGAFEESPNGFIPRMNLSHVQNGLYRTIGHMMSTIIVQGGEPPALLSPLVVDYLLTGDSFQVNVTPDDITDKGLRDSLKKVGGAATTDDLEQALQCCDSWRHEIEGLPNPVSMENKDVFVQNAVRFHVLIQRQCCYDQLAEGLKYYEVLPLLRENPCLRVFLDMPKESNDVSADTVATLLKPSYSVLGSNRRPKEELMVVKFREFLHCVQEREVGERLNARSLTEAEKAFIHTVNPGHILAFATGSSKVPAIGFFPSPKLTFSHDDTKHLPLAHTCSNELQIFVNSKNLADDAEFDHNFIVALMNGAIFSAV